MKLQFYGKKQNLWSLRGHLGVACSVHEVCAVERHHPINLARNMTNASQALDEQTTSASSAPSLVSHVQVAPDASHCKHHQLEGCRDCSLGFKQMSGKKTNRFRVDSYLILSDLFWDTSSPHTKPFLTESYVHSQYPQPQLHMPWAFSLVPSSLR